MTTMISAGNQKIPPFLWRAELWFPVLDGYVILMVVGRWMVGARLPAQTVCLWMQASLADMPSRPTTLMLTG